MWQVVFKANDPCQKSCFLSALPKSCSDNIPEIAVPLLLLRCKRNPTFGVQSIVHDYLLYWQASVYLRLVSSQRSAAFERYRSGRDYRRSCDGRNAQQKHGSSTSPTTHNPLPGRPGLLHLCSESKKKGWNERRKRQSRWEGG